MNSYERKSQREQIQQALDACEARFRNVIDKNNDGILIVSPGGLVRFLNQAAEKLLGRPANELLDAHFGFPLVIAESTELDIVDPNQDHKVVEMRVAQTEWEGQPALIASLRDISEHKRVQNELAQANERITSILDSISDGFFVLDDQLVVTYFNAAAERLLGRSAQEVLGCKLFDVFPEGQGSIFEEKYTQALCDKTPLAFEVYFGVAPYENWYNVRVHPFDQGISVYFQVTTEQRQAAKALADSERRLKSLFDNSLDAILLSDDRGCYVDANPAACDLIGYSRQELLNLSVFDITPVPSLEVGRAMWQEFINNGAMEGEYQLQRPDGGTVDVEFRAAAHVVPGLHMSTLRDVTHRKQAEVALRAAYQESKRFAAESAALLHGARAVLQYSDFDVAARIIFDTCKNLIGAKSGYIALLSEDGSENEVLFLEAGGLPCTVDPELPMPIRGLRAEAYHTGQAVYDNHFATSAWTQYLPGGHVTLHNVLFAPLTIEGQPVGLLGLANKDGDFTDYDANLATAFGELASLALWNSRTLDALEASQAALQQHSEHLEEMVSERTRELEAAQEQLVRREKLAVLGQLSGSVGHELRNPLGVISNAAYYLKMLTAEAPEHLTADTVHEYLGMIDAQVRDAQKTIDDLLNFARVRASDRKAVTVRELIDRSLDKCPSPDDVRVDVQVADKLSPLFVDPHQLEHVLTNLVTNAYQAMPQGGQLTVSAREPDSDGTVALSIADSGVGIAPQHMERLFEPLFSTKAKGIGLGLALARTLVEANEGSIEVQSAEEEGTTFTLTLPTA